jgi:hypothetical protein
MTKFYSSHMKSLLILLAFFINCSLHFIVTTNLLQEFIHLQFSWCYSQTHVFASLLQVAGAQRDGGSEYVNMKATAGQQQNADKYSFKSKSSGLWRCAILPKDSNVSKDLDSSIFREVARSSEALVSYRNFKCCKYSFPERNLNTKC